jgi:hypothetical protein
MAILFANNVEALMGTVEDPPDGGAVARTCIGAAVVYAVNPTPPPASLPHRQNSSNRGSRCFSRSVDVKLFYIGEVGGLNYDRLNRGDQGGGIVVTRIIELISVWKTMIWTHEVCVYNLEELAGEAFCLLAPRNGDPR